MIADRLRYLARVYPTAKAIQEAVQVIEDRPWTIDFPGGYRITHALGVVRASGPSGPLYQGHSTADALQVVSQVLP